MAMKIGEWVGLIALGVSLVILWQIRSALMLVFAAIVLASALNTIASRLQRFGLKRGGSLASAILLVLGILGLSLWLVVPPFMDQFQQMTTLFPKGVQRFNANFDTVKASLPPFISSAISAILFRTGMGGSFWGHCRPVIRQDLKRNGNAPAPA